MLKNLEALRVFFKGGRVFVTAGRSLRSIVNRVTRPLACFVYRVVFVKNNYKVTKNKLK